MAASYSLEEFVGEGRLKEILGKLEADGWDDVPTVKVMSAADMEALQLTDQQKDALEIRTYLHDRNLIQYGDRLEAEGKRLPELLNTNPSDLVSQYGMRRGHVARFLDRSSACGIQMPPSLVLPARKRVLASRDGDSEYSYMSSRASRSEQGDRSPSAASEGARQQRRMGYDRESTDSRQNGNDLGRRTEGAKGRKVEQERVQEEEVVQRMPDEESMPSPRISTTSMINARMCGMLKPTEIATDVTPLSVLEKIYVQRITPEFKTGVDPWKGGGDLKLPPSMKASELWKTKTTLLLCIRRPGCVMCRAEAHQLYARKPIFDAMGVQLVAVLNDYIDAEVRQFWPRYWGGQVVLDRNRDLFKALGGGILLKDNLITGFMFNSQARRNWKRATSTGFVYNLKGEGNIKGGLYVIAPGKRGVAYQFIEATFGDWAPLEEVLDICSKIRGIEVASPCFAHGAFPKHSGRILLVTIATTFLFGSQMVKDLVIYLLRIVFRDTHGVQSQE